MLFTADSVPRELDRAVRSTVHDIDSSMPVVEVAAVEDLKDRQIQTRRAVSFVGSFAAAVAVALSALGLFAVVGRSVVEREVELATRSALGATFGRNGWLLAKVYVAYCAAGGLAGAALVKWGAAAFSGRVGIALEPVGWVYSLSVLFVATILSVAVVLALRPIGRGDHTVLRTSSRV